MEYQIAQGSWQIVSVKGSIVTITREIWGMVNGSSDDELHTVTLEVAVEELIF